MDREGKLYQDEMTVEKYRQQLKEEKKPYGQVATVRAANQRRARGLALGEAALKIMDAVRETSRGHRLINGTLCYMLDEQVEYPITGVDRKEFVYTVKYQVLADEPAYTENEIELLCEDLAKRLQVETDEMYPEVETDDQMDQKETE